MSKEAATPQEEILEAAQEQTENFFEKNSKTMVVALAAIFVLAAAVFGYKKLVVEPRMGKAQEMLYEAQYRFEQQNADYALALDGDTSAPGFAEVADKYGNTPAGNLARLYAASCALRLGDLDRAEKYIGKYSDVKGVPGQMVNAMAAGIKGDIAVEKGDYAKAAALFEKAVRASDNDFTAPMYLRKAALAFRAAGNESKAEECLRIIQRDYPASIDARDAAKYVD